MSAADRVMDALGPGIAERAGEPLLRAFVEGLTTGLDDVAGIVSGDEGWADQFDLDETTSPGWLGQLVGVVPPAGSVEQQRLTIRARGYSRGTVDSIRKAAQATLTGTKRVTITERTDADAYAIEVITYESETPSLAATLAAILAVKPGGLILTYDAPLGQTYRDVKNTGQTYQQIKDSGLTYDQFRRVVPSA